jgi:hypothetical protein
MISVTGTAQPLTRRSAPRLIDSASPNVNRQHPVSVDVIDDALKEPNPFEAAFRLVRGTRSYV